MAKIRWSSRYVPLNQAHKRQTEQNEWKAERMKERELETSINYCQQSWGSERERKKGEGRGEVCVDWWHQQAMRGAIGIAKQKEQQNRDRTRERLTKSAESKFEKHSRHLLWQVCVCVCVCVKCVCPKSSQVFLHTWHITVSLTLTA